MCLERPELLAPERVNLVEPGLEGDEWFRAEAVHADPSIVVNGRDLHEAIAPQYPEVPTQRGAAHPGGGGQVARPPGALRQEVDDPATGGIGESSERVVEIIHALVNL
jgi:hypothetical protein